MADCKSVTEITVPIKKPRPKKVKKKCLKCDKDFMSVDASRNRICADCTKYNIQFSYKLVRTPKKQDYTINLQGDDISPRGRTNYD